MARKRKRRKKSNKKIVILLLVAIIPITIAAAIYSLQFHNPHVQKKPAEGYFKVLNARVLIGEPLKEKTWKISFIAFELQAIGGDAHNVVIKSWAMSDPQELEDIPENESMPVLLQAPSPHGYVVDIDKDGMLPVIITVTSEEAEGRITILVFPPI